MLFFGFLDEPEDVINTTNHILLIFKTFLYKYRNTSPTFLFACIKNVATIEGHLCTSDIHCQRHDLKWGNILNLLSVFREYGVSVDLGMFLYQFYPFIRIGRFFTSVRECSECVCALSQFFPALFFRLQCQVVLLVSMFLILILFSVIILYFYISSTILAPILAYFT